jgi:hypothetical protein
MKGLILEKQARSYTILTSSGEYKKIRGFIGEEVGQEVTISLKPSSKAFRATIMVAILTIAIILSQVLPSMLWHSQAYAYVSLDINPSVEFAIDSDYIVLTARPYNRDAESILSELEYEGKEIGSVLADFTQSAISLRYIRIDSDEPSQVVVSFYSEHVKDEESASMELVRITEAQRRYLNETGGKAEINTVVVDEETHNEAQRLGISAGMLRESKQKEIEGESSHIKESIFNPVKQIEKNENLNKDSKAKTEQKLKNEGKEKTNYKKVNSNKTSNDKKVTKDRALKKNHQQGQKQKGNSANQNTNKAKFENNSNISSNKGKAKKDTGKGKGEKQKKNNKSKKYGKNREKKKNNSKNERTRNKER